MTFRTVDVMFYDTPEEWYGWPISSRFEAQDFAIDVAHAQGADRVEVMLRRSGHPDEAPMPLVGRVVSIAESTSGPIVFIDGDRLNDDHSMRGLYFVMPVSCIRRVLSRRVAAI